MSTSETGTWRLGLVGLEDWDLRLETWDSGTLDARTWGEGGLRDFRLPLVLRAQLPYARWDLKTGTWDSGLGDVGREDVGTGGTQGRGDSGTLHAKTLGLGDVGRRAKTC